MYISLFIKMKYVRTVYLKGWSIISMRKTIYLHGSLSEYHDRPIEVEAVTVAEALRFLEQYIEVDEPISVKIDDVESYEDLFQRQDIQDIHVRTITFGGGGKGGLAQILIGVALVALSFAIPGAGLLVSTAGKALISASSVFSAGVMMALGGILQLLMPSPEDREEEKSQYFGAVQNTVAIDTPIPLIYGTRRFGGQILSFDVDTKRVVNSDASEGVTVEAGDGIHKTYDTLPLVNPIRPLRSYFAGEVPSLSNPPMAG